MTNCPFCAGLHESSSCPLFGKTEEYLKACAPSPHPPAPEPPSSSLAPTQFEELYGQGAEPLLLDALEDPDLTPGQQDLAQELAYGTKQISDLSPEEREELDVVTRKLVYPTPAPAAREAPVRPGYVSTWQEMEETPPEGGRDAFSEVARGPEKYPLQGPNPGGDV